MTGLGNRLPASQKGRLTCKCKKKNRCEEQLKNGTLRPGTKVYFNAAAIESYDGLGDPILIAEWIQPLTITGFTTITESMPTAGTPVENLLYAHVCGVPPALAPMLGMLGRGGGCAELPPFLLSCRRLTPAEYDAAHARVTMDINYVSYQMQDSMGFGVNMATEQFNGGPAAAGSVTMSAVANPSGPAPAGSVTVSAVATGGPAPAGSVTVSAVATGGPAPAGSVTVSSATNTIPVQLDFVALPAPFIEAMSPSCPPHHTT